MRNAFKKYKENRKSLNSDTKKYYLKKLLFPTIIIVPIFILSIMYSSGIKHTTISAGLVSVSAIIVAFLVFSMTILLTKENEKEVENSNKKYLDILINNTEVLAIISSFSIFVNLVYMFISNFEVCLIPYWSIILNIFSFIAFFLTILIIKMAIDDLLFLSRIYEKRK